MTDDEQEAGSTRYIAPRVMRLHSGRVALIDMIGNGIQLFTDPQALWDAIPNSLTMSTAVELLDAQRKRALREAHSRPTPTRKASLDDLA